VAVALSADDMHFMDTRGEGATWWLLHRFFRGMSLEEFKFIYWMEYAHRMWGRALGLVFAVPATYFVARGWVNAALGRRLGLLFAMGAAQGLVGWWMVRSGLQVSYVRLPCTHPYWCQALPPAYCESRALSLRSVPAGLHAHHRIVLWPCSLPA
jgi:hypothetical protein